MGQTTEKVKPKVELQIATEQMKTGREVYQHQLREMGNSRITNTEISL